MQSIDFLPTRYREQAMRRHTRMWSLTLSILFGSLVLIAATVQFGIRFSVRRQVSQLEASYQGAINTKKTFDAITTELQQRQHSAKLYAYLGHPWPRTQILKQVVSPLPESILLREMRFAMESQQVNGPPPTMTSDASDTKNNGVPPERDLKTLRKQRDDVYEWLYITGVSQDVSELHQYVDAISRSPMFEKAELRSLEASTNKRESPDSRSSAQFVLTVQMKPGYGQPGGPRPKEEQAAADKPSKDTATDAAFHSAETEVSTEQDLNDRSSADAPFEHPPTTPPETQSASANIETSARS